MDALNSYPIGLSAYRLGNTLTPQDMIFSADFTPVDSAQNYRILSAIQQDDALSEKRIGDV
ncbi:MAG: hypothetical protein O2857_02905 [Planctomycetota bacterium]|nr:hypothetical protein [Planctomycetota bacterium]